MGDQFQHALLLQGPSGISPMTFGILSPRVVIPANLSHHLSLEEIRAVLAHELSHIRNRDALLGLFQSLAAMFYWWNPLIHVLLRKISLIREMLSDREAANHLHPAAYATSLLRLVEKAPSLPTSDPAYGISLALGPPLEQRFKMLVHHFNQQTKKNKNMKQTIAIYSTLIATTLLCATINTSFAKEPPKLPERVPSTITIVKDSFAQDKRKGPSKPI